MERVHQTSHKSIYKEQTFSVLTLSSRQAIWASCPLRSEFNFQLYHFVTWAPSYNYEKVPVINRELIKSQTNGRAKKLTPANCAYQYLLCLACSKGFDQSKRCWISKDRANIYLDRSWWNSGLIQQDEGHCRRQQWWLKTLWWSKSKLVEWEHRRIWRGRRWWHQPCSNWWVCIHRHGYRPFHRVLQTSEE